jgi:hypothetical protein
MTTSNSKSRLCLPAFAIGGLLLAGGALAAPQMDTSKLPTPSNHTEDCAQVIWDTQLVSTYPRIASGCREVVMVNGKKWARFEGDFVRNNEDGSFTTEFIDLRDRSLGNVTLMPKPGQQVTLSGTKTYFRELRADQRLNLYVPEGASGFAMDTTEPVDRYASLVRYEAAPEIEPAPQPEPDRRMAQMTPANPPLARLPDTAGPLPLLALGSVLSLFGGSALALRRRLRARKA